MNYEQARERAINFLLSFTRSDFTDMKVYSKMKMYRSRHKKGKLTKGSYEFILSHLGYEKKETFTMKKESPYLIDILT